MSDLMYKYLLVVLAILCGLGILSLIYAILGKRFTDKIVATNMLGSQSVNMIVILAVMLGADYILDISLVFALLSFLMVIVLCRFAQNRIAEKKKLEKTQKEAEE